MADVDGWNDSRGDLGGDSKFCGADVFCVSGRHWEVKGGSNSVVESQPSKLLVAGSIPVSRSRLRLKD